MPRTVRNISVTGAEFSRFCATCVFPYKRNCSQFDLSALLPVSSPHLGKLRSKEGSWHAPPGPDAGSRDLVPPPCRYPPVTKETSAFRLTCRDIRDLPPPFVMPFLFLISSPFSLTDFPTALIIAAYSGIWDQAPSLVPLSVCYALCFPWRGEK